MKRAVVIRISMACSMMFGLKKKMTATAAHSQTLNCAKAASCVCHIAKLKYLSKTPVMKLQITMFQMLRERKS